MTRSRPETPPAPGMDPAARRTTAAPVALFLLALLAALAGRAAQAQDPIRGTVTEVRIVGNASIAEDEIRRQIRTRPGREIDRAVVDADIKRLLNTKWFSDVQASLAPDPRQAGGLVLTFTLVEMPVLRAVEYRGRDKVREKDLVEATGLKPGARADHVRNMLAVNQLKRLYEEKGYAMAEVRLLEGGKPGDTRAIFEIFEGDKCKVVGIRFAGNTLVSDATLRTKITTRSAILGFRGLYRQEDIEEDARALRQYYMGLGFFEVKVSPLLQPGDTLGEKIVEFAIWEGVQYKVREIRFEGNERLAETQLRQGLVLHSGQPFRQELFEADKKRLEEQYGEIGCIDAVVEVERRYADPVQQPGVIDLVYHITEGEPYLLGRFIVKGNARTRDSVIRREAEMAGLVPGEPLNLKRLELYRQRLANLGYFVADPTANKPEINIVDRRPGERPYGEVRQIDLDEVIRTRLQDPGPEADLDDFGAPVPGFGADLGTDTPPPAAEVGAPEFVLPPPALAPAPDGGAVVAPAEPLAPGPGPAAVVPFGAGGAFDPPPGAPLPPIAVPVAPAPAPDPGMVPGTAPLPIGAGEPPGMFPSMPGANMTDVGPDRQEPFANRSYADIVTQVEEAPTGKLMFGAGFNSYGGLSGNFILHERNFDILAIPRSWRDWTNGTAFRGAGQDLRIELSPGTLINRALISFRDPYLFDLPGGYAIGFGVSAYTFTRIYPGQFDEGRTGGRFSLGSQLGTSTYADFAVRVEDVRVSGYSLPAPADILAVDGHTFLTTLRPSLRFDNRNDPYAPNKGQYAEFAFEQGFGDFTFPKFTAEGRQYFTLGSRADGSGKRILTTRGFFGISGPDTPVYERFFAGDFRSMRGFSYRGVGPRVLGTNVGGIMTAVGSVEYQFPWTASDKLQQVVFCDFGTVESDYTFTTFRAAVGTGLRIYLPREMFGPLPLAFDFAFPIAKSDEDRERIFTFFIGAFW